MSAPTQKDYVIYFIVNLIGELAKDRKSLINKFNYVEIYYSMVELIFKYEKLEEGDEKKRLIEDTSEFEDYHFQWFEK